jgi:hypothetical protein
MIPTWTAPLLPQDATPEQMVEWVNAEMVNAMRAEFAKANEMTSRCKPDGSAMFFVPIE